PVQDGNSIGLRFRFSFNFHIEETLLPELFQQILASFLKQLRSETVLLIDRKELVFGPRPKARALEPRMHDGAGFDVERDVRAIRFWIIVRADQLHLSRKVIFLL